MSAHLGAAGSGETNFVGGAGSQLLFGGQGANILTYLAIGDGGDLSAAFDPAKDIIDLSRVDGDMLTAGVQNFTFIGSAPFDGRRRGALSTGSDEQRHSGPSRASGRHNSRFYLNARGTEAAHGRKLRPHVRSIDGCSREWRSAVLHPVPTAAGAPTEYAYSSVQGRPYTSYELFYGSTYEDIAADDLNLSSNTNKLVLYDPGETVTRGGGSESLHVGTGIDPLAYHAVETIDASTSTGEQFIFSAGFGKETINGFSVSGTTPDSIQLAKAAFSYLTPGMTQAEDLAAAMSKPPGTHPA